jgi:proline dehydrogenase
MFRSLFISFSTSERARNFVTHFGPARAMARRFIAGETMDEAVAVVKELNQRGIKAILNEVGEHLESQAEAKQAAAAFHDLLRRIDAEGLDSTISLKPSHVGMTFGADFCFETIADIVQVARQYQIGVEVDMEGSADVEDTLAVYHRLLDTFGGGIRLAIQAYLYRTPADIDRIIERGGGVRLVKGAYQEPPEIAYQDREEIRQACRDLMAKFLTPEAQAQDAFLILGSHDPALIEWLTEEAASRGLAKDRFEFQMLLGVRRDEQQRLADLGYQVRVYVPYGQAWYPYFMRRLAERPANVFFLGRAMLGK